MLAAVATAVAAGIDLVWLGTVAALACGEDRGRLATDGRPRAGGAELEPRPPPWRPPAQRRSRRRSEIFRIRTVARWYRPAAEERTSAPESAVAPSQPAAADREHDEAADREARREHPEEEHHPEGADVAADPVEVLGVDVDAELAALEVDQDLR